MPAIVAIVAVVASGAGASFGIVAGVMGMSAMTAAVVGGIVVGAVAGGITAAVMGEDVLKGALMGGLAGGFAGYGIGAAAQNAALQTATTVPTEASMAGNVSSQMATGTMAPADAVAVTSENAIKAGVDVGENTLSSDAWVKTSHENLAKAGSDNLVGAAGETSISTGAELTGAAAEEVGKEGLLGALGKMSVTDKMTLAASTLQGAGSFLSGADEGGAPERPKHTLSGADPSGVKVTIDKPAYEESGTSIAGALKQPTAVNQAPTYKPGQVAQQSYTPDPEEGLLNRA